MVLGKEQERGGGCVKRPSLRPMQRESLRHSFKQGSGKTRLHSKCKEFEACGA